MGYTMKVTGLSQKEIELFKSMLDLLKEMQREEALGVAVEEEQEKDEQKERRKQWRQFNKGAKKVFNQLLGKVGITDDSVEILRNLRNERASR